MLLPKRVKYRRVHRGRLTGKATKMCIRDRPCLARVYGRGRGLAGSTKNIEKFHEKSEKSP